MRTTRPCQLTTSRSERVHQRPTAVRMSALSQPRVWFEVWPLAWSDDTREFYRLYVYT